MEPLICEVGLMVWDVDGGEYVDFHNGFGVMCVGHANPVIGEAVMRDGIRIEVLAANELRVERVRVSRAAAANHA